MFPVVHALRASEWFSPVVITTGQHRDLVEPILELAGIVPDHDLEVGRPGLTLNDLVGMVIERLDAYLPPALRRDRRVGRHPRRHPRGRLPGGGARSRRHVVGVRGRARVVPPADPRRDTSRRECAPG